MTRPILADGKPYARRAPVRWDFVRQALRYRQDERDAFARGFVKVCAFSSIPWESPNVGWRIAETLVNRDGSALYARVEKRK